jgi:hypothetical protein
MSGLLAQSEYGSVPPEHGNQASAAGFKLLGIVQGQRHDTVVGGFLSDVQIACRLSLRALVTTLNDDKAMAAAAIIGDSRIPNSG